MGWNFNNSAVTESVLKPLCVRVDEWFQLPTDRLYRYFAVVDDEFLADRIGKHYRGVRADVSGTDEVCNHIRELCLPPGSDTQYDTVIYMRNSTCADPTSCVITYAHELQHIAQRHRFPKLLRANSTLYANLRRFEPTATEIDIPSEVDANIVSKRVAETVCGVEFVRSFAHEQVRLMTAPEQAIRWKFFLDTPSSTTYDFVGRTLELVEIYKGRMDFGMDVDTPRWWEGSVPTDDAGTW